MKDSIAFSEGGPLVITCQAQKGKRCKLLVSYRDLPPQPYHTTMHTYLKQCLVTTDRTQNVPIMSATLIGSAHYHTLTSEASMFDIAKLCQLYH